MLKAYEDCCYSFRPAATLRSLRALYKAGMNVVRLNTAHMMEEGLTVW